MLGLTLYDRAMARSDSHDTVREQEGASRERTRTTHVPVTVLGQTHKITTNRWAVELLQTEKVTDRRKAVTLDIAVYDGAIPITNVERMTFDSASDVFEEPSLVFSSCFIPEAIMTRKPYAAALSTHSKSAVASRNN